MWQFATVPLYGDFLFNMRSVTTRRLEAVFFLIFSILATVCPAGAQHANSTLMGVVRSDIGQPIPLVKIEWIQNGQQRSLETDSSGRFISHFVEPGLHTFKFRHTSTSAGGSFTGLVPAGSSLELTVTLAIGDHLDPTTQDRWRIREELPGPPNVWVPDLLLTRELMEQLPSTEHLWSFLNQFEPSVVADHFDISGMHSDTPFRIGVRGSSWSQNQGLVNGMSVSHPSGDAMLNFPDITAMDAIVYGVGESQTLHVGPGAHVSMFPKLGGRETHGEARLFFQSGALQDTNVTARNRSFDITQSDERWKHFFNGGFQLAGPIGKLPWTYFAAISGRELTKWVRTQPLPISGTVGQQTYNFAGTVSPRDRVGIYLSFQHRNQPQYGASTLVTREASVDQRQNYRGIQGSWSREVSARDVLDVRFGVTRSHIDQKFQDGVEGQSVQDLFAGFIVDGISPQLPQGAGYRALTGIVRGPAPRVTNSDIGLVSATASYTMLRNSFRRSTHRINFGGSYNRSMVTNESTAIDGVNLFDFMQLPNSVQILTTPTNTRDRMHNVELYASDNFSFSHLSFLAEGYANASRTSNILKSGQSANDLKWNNYGGRIGAALQLIHRMVIRASMAQIYDQPNLAFTSQYNPEGTGVQLYSWNDVNGDHLFQSGENTQLLKVTGGPYTRLDPNLKNPRTSEYTVGFAQNGLHGFNTEFYGFRRTVNQMMTLVNEGVPFSSYTAATAIDPGWDAVLGTGDDKPVTVYNQSPATLGKDRYVLTNPAGFTSHSEGFEFSIGVNAPLIQAKVTVTRYRSVADTGPGLNSTGNDIGNLLGVYDDPNKVIHAHGSTYFDRGTLLRMWTTARLPKGFRISAVGNYQDGLPYARVLPVTLNQGTIGVLLTQRGPGDFGTIGGIRTTHYQTMDFRFSKEFSIGGGRLHASLDIFNIANLSLTLVQPEVTARTAYWRVPIQYQTPRSIQPGIRYSW